MTPCFSQTFILLFPFFFLQIDFLNKLPSLEDYFALHCMNESLMLRFTSFVFLRLICGFHFTDNLREGLINCLITMSMSLIWRLTKLNVVTPEHETQYERWRYSEDRYQNPPHGDIISTW